MDKRRSNLNPTQKLFKISIKLDDSKKMKKNPTRNKKNRTQDKAIVPNKYFNLLDIFKKFIKVIYLEF